MNIDKQKQKLLSEKESIEKELKSLGYELNNSHDWVLSIHNQPEEHMDPGDDAKLTEELEDDLAVFNVLEKRYTQVQKALDALENGTYGICEVCSEKISENRLEAQPSATTCINHAE